MQLNNLPSPGLLQHTIKCSYCYCYGKQRKTERSKDIFNKLHSIISSGVPSAGTSHHSSHCSKNHPIRCSSNQEKNINSFYNISNENTIDPTLLLQPPLKSNYFHLALDQSSNSYSQHYTVFPLSHFSFFLHLFLCSMEIVCFLFIPPTSLASKYLSPKSKSIFPTFVHTLKNNMKYFTVTSLLKGQPSDYPVLRT